MTANKKLVVPGEEVGTSEEFLSGQGTFEDGGKIFSNSFGMLEFDAAEKVVKVKPINPPVVLNVGDIIYAMINDIRGSMATVDVLKVVGKDREISTDTAGSIHISKISETYTQDIGREFRVGDIIRARVIQVKPSLQLSTVGTDFGVIRALCFRCRKPLKKQGNALFCLNCERVESRKMAMNYDNIEFNLNRQSTKPNRKE